MNPGYNSRVRGSKVDKYKMKKKAKFLPCACSLEALVFGYIGYFACVLVVLSFYLVSISGENAGEIIARLKHDLLPTLVRSLLFWPISNFFTYKFTPAYLQVKRKFFGNFLTGLG